MALIPTSVADILKSKTRRGLPHPVDYPKVDVASYVQGADNFHKVMAIKPGDHVVMLTDPLIDPRVLQAVYGVAKARGATFTSYMARRRGSWRFRRRQSRCSNARPSSCPLGSPR
jgi:hypothetical protein